MAGYIGSKSSVTLVDGYSEAEADAEFVNDPNGAITVSGSNVGIGTSSPSAPLTVKAPADAEAIHVVGRSDDIGQIKFMEADGTTELGLIDARNSFFNIGSIANIPLKFATNNSERMRINSSGNVLVGTTNADVGFSTTSGSALHPSGQTHHSSAGTAIVLNRTANDGTIIQLRRAGATVGSIGSSSGVTYYAHSNGDGISISNNYIFPSRNGGARDNQIDLGISWARWDNIWATNGTIQTSDFNEKQDIASLTATEMLVGKRISALFKTFRWKDKVVEKGDNARTHTGIIAQDVQAAFTAEGLDAGDYALFISDTWWETQTEVPAVEAVAEVTDEDGNVTTGAVEAVDAYTRTDTYEIEDEAPEGATERTRLGIRYPELLSFVAAYNEQRFASIEARLTALEA